MCQFACRTSGLIVELWYNIFPKLDLLTFVQVFCIILLLAEVAFLTSISSLESPNLSSNALHMTTNIKLVVKKFWWSVWCLNRFQLFENYFVRKMWIELIKSQFIPDYISHCKNFTGCNWTFKKVYKVNNRLQTFKKNFYK